MTGHGADASPRLALVTGGSSGIGAAVVMTLAGSGWDVLSIGRDAERLRSVAEAAARLARGRVRSHVVDLTAARAPDELAALLGGGHLHALVHAAGVVRLATVADGDVEDLDAQWQVNTRAPYAVTRALLPALRRAPGDVVFVNSGSGLRANAGWGAYAATKFALRALADALRAEERQHGVRVTSVYPGRTDTPMQREVFAAEGRPYDAADLVPADAVADAVVAALETRRPAAVPDVEIRPL